MAERAKHYMELDVWVRSRDLALEVYRVSRGFPREEIYGLTSQLRRAAVSVPSNIAEGAGRFGRAEYRRFISIARGSLAELRTLLDIATKLGYLEEAPAASMASTAQDIERMLHALYRALAGNA